ncbi:MAG: FKBP-type peptidyl-prolyl cis-trans isomerase SlyD [Patiriisocius sp.]
MPQFYKFDYVIRNADGDMVDSSADGEALSFVQGDGSMIPGLEKALKGHSPGDEFSVVIRPEDAYGLPQKQLIRTVAKDMIQSDAEEIEVGMIFQMGSGTDGQVVRVTEVIDDALVIDGNHPLAGVTFNFDIAVLEAREALPGDAEED